MDRAAPKPPTWLPDQFSDHAILALGELAEFRPYSPVSEHSTIDRILHLAGLMKEPALVEIVTKALVQPGLVGRVGDGMSLTLAGIRKAIDLVFDGLDPVERTQAPHGRRSRTRLKVIDLTDDPNVNLTAKWIEAQGQPLIDKLRLWLGAKLKRSRVISQVDDHVQQFLLNMVKRDALREALLSGETISLAKIKGYTHNQGKTDIRDNSRNPVCRAIHGALTPKEQAEHKTRPPITVRVSRPTKAHENPNFTWAPSDNAEGATVPMEDIEDITSIDLMDQKLAFDTGFAAVEDVLRRRAPHNADQYTAVLYNRIVMDMTVREISEHMKITRNQAASLLRTAKNIIQREREAGRGKLEEAFGRD
jgi:hypothetical protein